MGQLKGNSNPITGNTLDQLLSSLIQPLVVPFGSSGLFTDANYTSPTPSIGTSAIAVDSLRSVPLLVLRTGIINRVGFVCTTLGGAGSVARCGVYASDPSNSNYPTTLLFDSGSFDTTVIGFKGSAVNIPVESGQLLWLSYVAGVANPTINAIGLATLLGNSSGNPIATYSCLMLAFPYAALPAVYPAAAFLTSSSGPAVLVRYA